MTTDKVLQTLNIIKIPWVWYMCTTSQTMNMIKPISLKDLKHALTKNTFDRYNIMLVGNFNCDFSPVKIDKKVHSF